MGSRDHAIQSEGLNFPEYLYLEFWRRGGKAHIQDIDPKTIFWDWHDANIVWQILLNATLWNPVISHKPRSDDFNNVSRSDAAKKML